MSRIPFRPALCALSLFAVFNAHAAGTDAVLNDVVVTATRQPMRADELLSDVTVISREEIERVGGASVVDLLGKQPGLQMMQNGGPGTSAEVYVRGSRVDQVKVLVDGMPINSNDTKGSPLRYLPLADVERIEILRGPASSLYGADAVGGVIQIITRRGSQGLRGNVYGGFGSYGAQRLAAGVSGGGERWRFHLGGSDFRTEGFSAIRNGRNRDADKDPFRSMGLKGSLDFLVAPGHELSGNWSRNHGQVFSDSTTGTGNFNSRTDFVNEVWNVASKNKLSSIWTSTVRYGKSIDDQASYTSANPNITITEGSLLGWQNDLDLPLGKGLLLAERTQQQLGPQSRFPRNNTISNNAVLIGWNGRLAAHSWQWSSRRDDHSSFGAKNTWSASYGYRVTNDLQLKAAMGTSFKAPTLYQLYASISGQLVPNPGLRPEEGRNKEVGLVWDIGGHTIDFTWYRNDLTNLIEYRVVPLQYQNISRAKFEGTTLTWSSTVADWGLSATLDTLEARDLLTGKTLERRAKEKLHVAANRQWDQWNAGVELIGVGRRYSGNSSNTEIHPMGGYALLNLTARYAFTREWALEAALNNVTDKHYATARTSSGAYEYTAPGANYFVGLRYQMK